MKKAKILLLGLATFMGTLAVQAQTADDVVNKHIEAIGGKEKLGQLNSIYMETTIQVMGNEAPSTTTIVNGKGYRNEAEVMGSKMIQVVTDQGGWAVNPMGGGAAEAMPEEVYKQSKDQLEIAGPLFNYAAKGNKVELLGQEKVGEVNAYKLKVTTKDGVPATYFIDPTTYYILQVVKTGNMMGQDMDVTTSFSNYKKTDFGFVMPYTVDINFGGQFAITATVNKVEINKTVDPAIFAMPAK